MQVNHFIRRHPFLQTSLVCHTTSQRRSFERDIYDYTRSLGLSTGEAQKEVLKGRAFCGEGEYHSDDTALGDEVDDSAITLRRLSTPNVSMPELPSNQPIDVPARAKAPRKRRQRKKQRTVEQSATANTHDVTMEPQVIAAQSESVEVPQRRSKASKDTTSKFFPKECELGKKRKRKTADATDEPVQKKSKMEAKNKKSKKLDDQATANTQVNQDIPSAPSATPFEDHGKGADIPAKPHAPTDDAGEGNEDSDNVGERGEVVMKSKNRKKMKTRKDKSKGLGTTTATTSTSAIESLNIVVAADKGSDLEDLATADNSTDHAVNKSLPNPHPSATSEPVIPSEASDHLTLYLKAGREALKAARRLKKQQKRRDMKGANRQLMTENDAAAVSPPVIKLNEPENTHNQSDDHPINQITGLPAPSINEMMGLTSPKDQHSLGSTTLGTVTGPNDPKSSVEAGRNLLRSTKPEPVEYGMNMKISKLDLKEIKSASQLVEEAGGSQADEEHAAEKRRKKKKNGHKKEHAANDAGSDNVKIKKVKQLKTEVEPIPREPVFQSPMIQ